MDRAEDVEASPVAGRIDVACTKSEDGGVTENRRWFGREADIGVNSANPRVDNRSGHIIEIAERDDDVRATRFTWNVFLLAGKPSEGRYIVDARELAAGKPGARDTYFGGYAGAAEQAEIHCPDNLGIDPQAALDRHPMATTTRVLTTAARDGEDGPHAACETARERTDGLRITGCEFTPDGRTLFLAIQHPGEGVIGHARRHGRTATGFPHAPPWSAVEREDGEPV